MIQLKGLPVAMCRVEAVEAARIPKTIGRVRTSWVDLVYQKSVWVKMKPGIGPQILVFGSIYQGKPFWAPIFDPQPNGCGSPS